MAQNDFRESLIFISIIIEQSMQAYKLHQSNIKIK